MSTSIASQPNIFGGPETHSTPVEATGTTSPPATNTLSDLFPINSSSEAARHSGGLKPSVYYYILLAVLVVLIILAAALTWRGHRIRRQYRSAAQLALARGEPPPWWEPQDVPSPVWGGTIYSRTAPGPADRWAALGGRRRERRWVRIPRLWDVAAEPETKVRADETRKGSFASDAPSRLGDGRVLDPLGLNTPQEEPFSDVCAGEQPLSLLSLLPEPAPKLPPPAAADARSNSGALTALDFFRNGLPRLDSDDGSNNNGNNNGGPNVKPIPVRELDRVLANGAAGEPVRVAVLVQMPTDGAARADDDGWPSSVELGVWEGVVAGTGAGSAGARGGGASTPLSRTESK